MTLMARPAATVRPVLARALALSLLLELPERWRHTVGVAERAGQLAPAVPAADRDMLVSAAWLHDIGYALPGTGFHPVDGAAYLSAQGWSPRVAALVAHHSGARHLARARGAAALLAGYPDEASPVTDALAYADQTVGPDGEPVSIEDRLAETLGRRGPASAQARAHRDRAPFLLAAAARVQRRMAQVIPVDRASCAETPADPH